MSCGLTMTTKPGLGTWPDPSASKPGEEFVSINERSRYFPLMQKSMAYSIMTATGKNHSGTQYASVHAGVQTAEEKSRAENFKW
jgi:hypothetical protein